jgi:hypothetical protein
MSAKQYKNMKTQPFNYKTQWGLIKALSRAADQPMTISHSWWLYSAKMALIEKWGWSEEEASKFVAAHHSGVAAYRATA